MRKPWNVNIERLEPLYRPGECPPTAIYISEDAKNHTSGMILKLLDSGANAHSEERLRILSTVEEAMEKVDNPNEFFERHALDILEGLGPYLTMGTPPIKQQDGNSGEVTILSADADNMHKVRKKARNMFSKVAQHLHRKEVVIFTKEQLSVVDWSRFSTNLDYATNTTLVIYSYMERFVDVLTELNEPKSYIADMVYVGAIWSRRLLGAIEFILKTYASWGDQDRHKPEPDGPPAENSIIRFRVSEQWDNVVHTLGEMLLSLVQFLAQAAIAWQEKNGDVIEFLKPKSGDLGQDSDGIKLMYLSQYLMLEIFDKMIGNMDLDLLSAYNTIHPWKKYPINRPFETVKSRTEVLPRPNISAFVNDCMYSAHEARLTYENVLRLRALLVRPLDEDQGLTNEGDDSKRDVVNSILYPLSSDGIAMLLALSICDSYVFPLATKHPGYNLLPGVIPNLWMGRHCLGLALKVLYTDSASVPRVDKIMVILVHLSQRIEDVNVGVEMLIDMPLYGLSKRLDNPLEKFNLADGVQVMCHTATLCPHPTLRLAVYRLLSRFFDLCDPEAQVMVLYEMTQGEKSSPVLEAAVRLLKDRIAYAFDNKEDHLHAMYHSTMVTDKFFDIIFRKPSAEHLMTLTGYYMQALNMYQFLLMRDNENETGVWSDDKISWSYNTFLNPLKKLVRVAKEKENDQAEHGLDMELLEMTLDAIDALVKCGKTRAAGYKSEAFRG